MLSEENGKKDIYIEIGDCEATNIFLNMNSDIFVQNRPDTYDTMISSLECFNIKIVSGLIIDRIQDLWISQLELFNIETKTTTYLDCRPSDLINLSLKLGISIFIYDKILYSKYLNKYDKSLNIKKNYSLNKLKELLEDSILKEEYEKSAKLKKLIESKENEMKKR
jgi:bifunctional DNase/RNase